MHLTPDEFVDVVEGTRSEASHPHLADCEACRRELADVRAAMTAAARADVPEPSPLFWQHFTARVNERIDAAPDARWWLSWTRPRVLIPLSAVALLAIVVALGPNRQSAPPAPVVVSAPSIEPASDAADGTDPLLTLVSDLSETLDVDSVSASGFAEPDSAERAVTQMNSDELLALKELLQSEMARSGA